MFNICLIIGWVVLLILLLYIWADVREIAGAMKESQRENKREQLRNSFGGRTSGKQALFKEEEYWKDEDQSGSGQADKRRAKEQARQERLDESEEQVLREVLTEFLG